MDRQRRRWRADGAEPRDRIVVLDLGKVVAVGTPTDIVGNDEGKRAYLGTTHAGVESPS